MHRAELDRARFEAALTRSMSRRGLLAATGGAAALAAVLSLPGRPTRVFGQGTPVGTPLGSPGASPMAGTPVGRAVFPSTPFTLGVASGDPLPDSVVLWTRLAPNPLTGGGMDPIPYDVRWELAADEGFARIERTGTTTASPTLAHSVHVDVNGLRPAAEYFYRFMVGGEISPTGRTKTAPEPGVMAEQLKLGVAGCAFWDTGFFAGYRDLAAWTPDLVFISGDYLYEYGPETAAALSDAPPPRTTPAPEVYNLADYRNRHALFKTDPDLQAAHAVAPFLAVWDDHEIENNWADEVSEANAPREEFLARRAAGMQAYYEHMPLRPSSFPLGADMQLYRRIAWGALAELQLLDGRQYRSDQPCGDGYNRAPCPQLYDPNLTMLGPDQERWLLANLDASEATWNVLAQQTIMAQIDTDPGAGLALSLDQWDGYPAARNRILSHVMSRGIENLVVLAGDIHASLANDLKADWADPASQTIGTEYVNSSLTAAQIPIFGEGIDQIDHVRYYDMLDGYFRATITPDRWTTEFRGVEDRTDADSAVTTLETFVTEAGSPGVNPA